MDNIGVGEFEVRKDREDGLNNLKIIKQRVNNRRPDLLMKSLENTGGTEATTPSTSLLESTLKKNSVDRSTDSRKRNEKKIKVKNKLTLKRANKDTNPISIIENHQSS